MTSEQFDQLQKLAATSDSVKVLLHAYGNLQQELMAVRTLRKEDLAKAFKTGAEWSECESRAYSGYKGRLYIEIPSNEASAAAALAYAEEHK